MLAKRFGTHEGRRVAISTRLNGVRAVMKGPLQNSRSADEAFARFGQGLLGNPNQALHNIVQTAGELSNTELWVDGRSRRLEHDRIRELAVRVEEHTRHHNAASFH